MSDTIHLNYLIDSHGLNFTHTMTMEKPDEAYLEDMDLVMYETLIKGLEFSFFYYSNGFVQIEDLELFGYVSECNFSYPTSELIEPVASWESLPRYEQYTLIAHHIAVQMLNDTFNNSIDWFEYMAY